MIWSPNPQALRDRLAVVAGATRGAGRGIAIALGEAGATVICTGRTTRASGASHSDYDRPETIEETAELVTRAGGTGIAKAVDHLDSAEVKRLAGDIRRTHGHIDILVNDIWGGEILKGGPSEWNIPIWKHDLERGLRILRLGVDTHLITSHCLLPLLITRPGGLLVEVTDGTFEYNAAHYRLSTFYDLTKISVNRLAFDRGADSRTQSCDSRMGRVLQARSRAETLPPARWMGGAAIVVAPLSQVALSGMEGTPDFASPRRAGAGELDRPDPLLGLAASRRAFVKAACGKTARAV